MKRTQALCMLLAAIFLFASGSAANAQWAEDGIPACSITDIQEHALIVSNGMMGAIIAWDDDRDYQDIYAQRVDSLGNLMWDQDGVPVCDYAGYQSDPMICSDGAAGAFIAWEDNRGADTDIYVNSVNYAGNEKVVTLLASSSAFAGEGRITVQWTVSNSSGQAAFSIWRQADGGGFVLVLDSRIERSGSSFSFIDDSCEPSRSYRYRVDVTEEGKTRTLFVTENLTLPAPGFALGQNNPNPFNPSTTIWFELAEASQVTLTVYNVKGEEVRVLADELMGAGRKSAQWDGRTDAGKHVASGVYFYRLEAGKFSGTRKMVLAR